MQLSNGLYEVEFDLSTLFNQFIKEKRFLANLSERTLGMYKEALTRYEAAISSKKITEQNLKDFVIPMREKGLAATTCNITIRNFNSFLSWAHKGGHIPKLKMQQLKEEKRIMQTVTDEQIKKLLAWKPADSVNQRRAFAILCTLIDCGFRVSEVLNLESKNVIYESLFIVYHYERGMVMKAQTKRTLVVIIFLAILAFAYYQFNHLIGVLTPPKEF